MSLVAAYSDSESGSDVEEEGNGPINSTLVKKDEIISGTSREIKKQNTSAVQDKSVIEGSIDDIVDDDEIINNKGTSLFSILPQPKTKLSEIVEENDDEFIKRNNQKVYVTEEIKPPKRSSFNLPTSQKSNKRQPVKILIPSLKEIDGDSCSDDEESKEKEKPMIKKKTTLFSMLPKPKHSVTVGANRNKVFSHEANRPLIPHTLTKKKDETKLSNKKNKQNNDGKNKGVSLVAELSGSDSDENDNTPTNFFSLSDDNTSNASDIKTIPEVDLGTKHVESASNTDLVEHEKIDQKDRKEPNVDQSNKGNSFFSNLFKSSSSSIVNNFKVSNDRTSNKSVEKPSSSINVNSSSSPINKQSVSLPSKISESYSDVTAPYSDVTAPYPGVTAPYSDVTAPYGNASTSYGSGSYVPSMNTDDKIKKQSSEKMAKTYPTSPNFFAYAYHKNESVQESMDTLGNNSEIDYYNKPNEDLPIDREALRALQGSKRRKEDINLIDIRADDIQVNPTDFLKNLTTESAEQQMRLMAKKDKDLPTSSQKRKHQITYLAHQAKERELQLQQAWSESLASKRQTQSKYGF